MSAPSVKTKRPGDFAATSPDDDVCSRQQARGLRLRGLVLALRALQKPYAETFWELEKFISRIEDELERLGT